MNQRLPVLLDDGSRKYVFGLGLAYAVDTAGTVEVYHTDGLGSVRAITNAAGTVTQTYQTDEFGIPTQTSGSSTQPFGYTGERRDGETGFLYLRARLYDPASGRFLQRDPFAGAVGNPLSLHRYTYVANNPINAIDPSGLASSGVMRNDVDTSSQIEPTALLQQPCLIVVPWFGCIYAYPSQRGRGNQDNEVVRDVKEIEPRDRERQCKILEGWYDEARKRGDSRRAEKVKQAQKALGCRQSRETRG